MALILSKGCANGLINAQGFYEMFNNGVLRIFTGDGPGPEYGAGGTLLFQGTAQISSAGNEQVYFLATGVNVATGTAGYFRLSHADDNPYSNANGTAIRVDGTCGIISGFCELLMSDLDMTAGYGDSFGGYITAQT